MKRLVIAAAVAATLAAGPAAAAAGAFGNWLVSAPDDGSGRVSASTESAEGARLAVGCAHGRTVVFIGYPDPLTIEASLAVRWRLDAGEVRAGRWQVDEDRASLNLDPALFRTIAGARRLTVDTGKRLDVFDLQGVQRVAALMDGCRAG